MKLTYEEQEQLEAILLAHLINLRTQRKDAKQIEDHQVVDEIDEEISSVKTLMAKVRYKCEKTS